jgi:perosamine synthetase
MMRSIPVSEPALGAVEREALQRCIDDGWISSEGPQVAAFEERIAELVGRRHGVAVSSGTAALDVAVELSGVGPGDEVILPSFTIISCVTQVVRAGATPVFVDSEPVTWNADIPKLLERIGPRTRAIILPHLYGLPADIGPVEEVAQERGIVLIEDAAEAHGQSVAGRPCGSFGAMSMLSFYPNKLITTGEGGMLLTDSEELAERARRLRNLGFRPERRFVHEELGWNYRMTNLQAALGVAQLDRWDDHLVRKRAIGLRYHELLADLEMVQLAPTEHAGAENLYWVVGLVVDEATGLDAITVMRRLADRKVGSRPFFYPLHRQPVLNRLGFGVDDRLPVAERLGDQGLYLPSGVMLADDDIVRSAEALRMAVSA